MEHQKQSSQSGSLRLDTKRASEKNKSVIDIDE